MHTKLARFFLYILGCWCLLASCVANVPELPTDTSQDGYEQEIQLANHLLILSIQGNVRYKRNGWKNTQPIYAGTLVAPTDLIYPQGNNIYLLLLCPDGHIKELLTSDLLSSDILDCKPQSSIYIFGETGSKRLIIQRGGKQSPAIPYLIYPRATIIKDAHITIEWNLVTNVSYYIITVFGNQVPTVSQPLISKDFENQDRGRWEAPLDLEQNIPYTVEICVYYINTQQSCTTDPAWNSVNTAFYYDPATLLDEFENQIRSNFTVHEVPEELYAKAYSFSQPNFTTPYGKIGLYGDAIKLIDMIVDKFPNSQLAKSPVLYNFLAELYLNVGLPVSANKSFEKAYELSGPGQEEYATALLGLANTTASQDNINLYQQALNEFESFQNDTIFLEQIHQACIDLGGACMTLTQCGDHRNECMNWSKETK